MSNKQNQSKKDANSQACPPIPGEFANWAGVNHSDLQTIIDFGFIQPTQKGQQKTGVIFRRIILPPKIAKELGNILTNTFKNDGTKKKTTSKKN